MLFKDRDTTYKGMVLRGDLQYNRLVKEERVEDYSRL
jgi:hypothetical protein